MSLLRTLTTIVAFALAATGCAELPPDGGPTSSVELSRDVTWDGATCLRGGRPVTLVPATGFEGCVDLSSAPITDAVQSTNDGHGMICSEVCVYNDSTGEFRCRRSCIAL